MKITPNYRSSFPSSIFILALLVIKITTGTGNLTKTLSAELKTSIFIRAPPSGRSGELINRGILIVNGRLWRSWWAGTLGGRLCRPASAGDRYSIFGIVEMQPTETTVDTVYVVRLCRRVWINIWLRNKYLKQQKIRWEDSERGIKVNIN